MLKKVVICTHSFKGGTKSEENKESMGVDGD